MVQCIESLIFESEEFLIVGTSTVEFEMDDVETGRLSVFRIKEGRKLELMTEIDLAGTIYSLAQIRGRLLAGIDGSVFMFCLENINGGYNLKTISINHGFIVVLKIKVTGDIVAIADVQKSVSVLEYCNVNGVESLNEVARDYNTNWMLNVEFGSSSDILVGADNSMNLFTLRRNVDSTLDDVKRKLEVCGGFHIGDAVNVMHTGIIYIQTIDFRISRHESQR